VKEKSPGKPARSVSLAMCGVLGLAGVLMCPADVGSQNRAGIPRTPDGRPDLQGFWTNGTITPLQRPPEFADKEFLTAQEAEEYERTALPRLLQGAQVDDTGRELNYTYMDRLRVVDGRRTSLIVDPPNGRLPRRGPQFTPRIGAATASSDDPERRTLDERCLLGVAAGSSSAAPPLVPNPINGNFYQFVQTPQYVVILSELIHDARILRLNGSHRPAAVRFWLGDSIAKWEGDTLVVDSANFNERRGWPGTERLHVVERFERIDANTIRYRATVEDAGAWETPWTVDIPFKATTQPVFEYACHEGNYTLLGILRGARVQERDAR